MQIEIAPSLPAARAVRAAPNDGRMLINAGSSGLGSHLLTTLEDCPQLFAFLVILGMTFEEERMELLRGSLLHVGLAHYYARKGARQKQGVMVNGQRHFDPDRFYPPADAIEHAAAASENPVLASRLVDLVQVKVARYERFAHAVETSQVVAVEEPLRFEFHGYPYTLRMDLVTENAGNFYVWDHKGTHHVDRVHDLYSASLQIAGLRHAARTHYRTNSVWINYVLWSVDGAKAPRAREFVRLETSRAPALADRLPMRVFQNWTLLRSLWQMSPWQWPQRGACVDRWGKRCPAYDLCMTGVDPTTAPVGPPDARLFEAARQLGFPPPATRIRQE